MSSQVPPSVTSDQPIRPRSSLRLLLTLPALIGLLLFALWVLGVVWGSGYAIINARSALASGYASADTLYLSAYAAMLQTYGVPSTGLDGLPFVPYHFGANWVAGQLAQLLNLSTFTVYNHIFPIVLPVLYIAAFLWFVAGLHPQKGWQRSILFWGVLLAGTVRMLPPTISETFGMTAFSFLSESNLLSFAFLFAMAGLLLRGIYRRRWFLWAGLPLACLAIGLTKQSTLYLFVAVLAVLFLYYRFYRRPAYWLAAFLVALVCIPCYLVSNGYYTAASVAPFDYLATVVHGSPLIWLLINFGWSWLYMGLRLRERKPPYPDLIVLSVLCIAGIIPTLLLRIPDGSGAYFIDLQRFVALAFLLAWLPSRPRFRLWQRVLLASISVLVLGNVLISALYLSNWLQAVQPAESAVLDQLEALAAADDKADTALYIPRDHPYWALMSQDDQPQTCPPIGFVAPALTGMALIDGVPNGHCSEIQGYGYSAYTEALVPLCDRAHEYGLSRVLVLDSLTTTSLIDCDASPDGAPSAALVGESNTPSS